jgi:hypothetical protein
MFIIFYNIIFIIFYNIIFIISIFNIMLPSPRFHMWSHKNLRAFLSRTCTLPSIIFSARLVLSKLAGYPAL